LRALGRASARIGEGAMPTHLVRVGKIARSSGAKMVVRWRAILPTLPRGACVSPRCASRHDDAVAEAAVAILQP
jgi:hypothetical protein